MSIPPKARWKISASSGAARLAIDGEYATVWASKPSKRHWLKIDLGTLATLAGLEVYWGQRAPTAYEFQVSRDGRDWVSLCATRHGEGGQDVFGFPPVTARMVRWTCEQGDPLQGYQIAEVNLYDAPDAAVVLEGDKAGVLGRATAPVAEGESITVDLRRIRSPLGVLIEWGEMYGTDFSVHLSDDGNVFREVGRIETGNGGVDNFWWRSTTARFLRMTVHKASSPEGATVNELKLRVLNKDRMPIGTLERMAAAGRAELYPQSLLGRQIYWTVLGEFKRPEDAIFDEFGNIEPRRGGPQTAALLRVAGALRGAPGCETIRHSLADGSLPIPTVAWSAGDIELQTTAVALGGEAILEYRVVNTGDAAASVSLVLAAWPLQVDPYWQHGGHAPIHSLTVQGREVTVNAKRYATLSREPDVISVGDLREHDLIRSLEEGPRQTGRECRSNSALVVGSVEFAFSLEPGEASAVVVRYPMRERGTLHAIDDFNALRERATRLWRKKLGPRRISVGDPDVSDTVEAQTAFILVNATRHSFKPGPRNYDRTWIRDGSAQALALLWAGLVKDARQYVLWYAQRIEPDGLVPPILNVDGTVNRGYGSNIEFDAQGEFVGIAAAVYRISKDRAFLSAILEPAVRACRFLEDLRARTDAQYGPESPMFGLVAPSISHEGYNKPSYSYWDDYFALSAFRDCAYLARAAGDAANAAHFDAVAGEFAAALTRSIRMTAIRMNTPCVPGSADRNDIDPSATAIAFEPCRVEDVLPPELLGPTYQRAADRVCLIESATFSANYSPYDVRILNAYIALGRMEDAFQLLSLILSSLRPRPWRGWAEVVWSDPRAPEYIGDMPHTWIGAEFAVTIRRMLLREQGSTLELFRAVPDSWWQGDGIVLRELPTAFGMVSLDARRHGSEATIALSITGAPPDRIRVTMPGVRAARADGAPCQIEGAVISTACFRSLQIDL